MTGRRFTKLDDELMGLGLPLRLVALYGKLAFHAGEDGQCYPSKWATLAKEIGLKRGKDTGPQVYQSPAPA